MGCLDFIIRIVTIINNDPQSSFCLTHVVLLFRGCGLQVQPSGPTPTTTAPYVYEPGASKA